MAHRGNLALPPAMYPPRRRGHGDVTNLPHRGTRQGGGRPEYIIIS